MCFMFEALIHFELIFMSALTHIFFPQLYFYSTYIFHAHHEVHTYPTGNKILILKLRKLRLREDRHNFPRTAASRKWTWSSKPPLSDSVYVPCPTLPDGAGPGTGLPA